RTLSLGDSGSDVAEVQRILNIPPIDGDFGPTTEGGVMGFQAAANLDVDGVVGPGTWAALDELDRLASQGEDGPPDAEIDDITQAAITSALARYSWPDRGTTPLGYVVGMALSFGLACKWLAAGESVAAEMAVADHDDPDTDALTW